LINKSSSMYILGRVNYLQRKVLEVIGKNVIENQTCQQTESMYRVVKKNYY